MLLRGLGLEEVLVSHYESYFYDPERELDRVTRHLGFYPGNDGIRSATAAISTDLRRLRLPVPPTKTGEDPWRSYLELQLEAGPVHQALRDDEEYQRRLHDLSTSILSPESIAASHWRLKSHASVRSYPRWARPPRRMIPARDPTTRLLAQSG